ncbi:MAG: hypothetical protein K0B84_11665, partial [Firmicutes bacterium]|nr:hypothetical protein [Bacillota bacterium]
HLPRFMRGWKALFNKSLSIETSIHCTPPGVLEFDGTVYSRRELQHGDRFECGGYSFHYTVRQDKDSKSRGRGVDILDGKM